MSKRPALAKSELEVARIVWELGRASVRQVLDALPAELELDFKTVQPYFATFWQPPICGVMRA